MKDMFPNQTINVDPVGFVENAVKEPVLCSHTKGLEMKGRNEEFWRQVRRVERIESRIIIDPKWSGLLKGIEAYSHLLVTYWAHKTPPEGRDLEQVHPMGCKDLPQTGVFSTCSPARPNPVLVSVVELVVRRENILVVKRLDAIDQSSVLDIKPYVKEMFPQEGVTVPGWMKRLMQETSEIHGSS